MTTGGTASAFVEMLEKRERALLAEKNRLQAITERGQFEYHQAVAHLQEVRAVLAEAIKLRNAIINEWEWRVKRDGSVEVNGSAASSVYGGSVKNSNSSVVQAELLDFVNNQEKTGDR